MKQFKKTIFWFIFLVVIGGAFFLTEDRVKEAERVEEASLKLLPFKIDDVSEFWISSAGEGVRARAEKRKDGWWLNKPLVVKGDDESIVKMLENIVKSRKDAILFEDPEPAKLKELGLETPKLEITFKFGTDETTVLFGDKGPTLNVTYAMFKGEPRVYRVHSDVRSEVDATVYALRDKSTLKYDPLKLHHLEVDRKGRGPLVITHDQGRWDMIEPEVAKASQAKVLETLYEIMDTPVKAFIDENPTDLAPYGLVPPMMIVSVFETGKKEGQFLYVGSKDRSRRGYFARANNSNNIVLLEENLVKNLLANDNAWKETGK